MALSLPAQMKASLAVVQASGAQSLELPTPKAGLHVQFGRTQEVSPMHCSQAGSPWAASTAPASPWSPVTPAVAEGSAAGRGSAFFPNPAAANACSRSGASFQGMAMSPKSPAASPTMSPGARIRRNAYRLGIPLDLKVEGMFVPVPVATSADEVLALSPVAGPAPMEIELPQETAVSAPAKAPQNIVTAPRPSASRFSGA